MNWELTISILALVTGGGCLTWIFLAGLWKGGVDNKLKTLRKELDEIPEKIKAEVGLGTGQFNATVNTALGETAAAIRQEMIASFNRVHERLDEKNVGCQTHMLAQQNLQNRLDALITGLQSQRQEWDALRADVRALLHSEATTTNEIINFKERLSAFEKKIIESGEKIVRLESDMAHVDNRKK